MSEKSTSDIWDGEWDVFQNKCVELAVLWIRTFNNNMHAFAMERVIDSIRQNALSTPPKPWSELVPSASIPKNNPFLRILHTPKQRRTGETKANPISKSSYILTHPCLILMNIFHAFQTLIYAIPEADIESWNFMRQKIENILVQRKDDINKYQETMSFEVMLKNAETGRYTELYYTRTYDNTDHRLKRLRKRYKKYYSKGETDIIRLNRRMEILTNPIPMMENDMGKLVLNTRTSDIGDPVDIPADAINIYTSQDGIYGPTNNEMRFIQDLSIKRSHEWNKTFIMF